MDPGTLTVIFVILKLTHVIAWAWLWVFSPLWISSLVVLVGLILYLGFMALVDRV